MRGVDNHPEQLTWEVDPMTGRQLAEKDLVREQEARAALVPETTQVGTTDLIALIAWARITQRSGNCSVTLIGGVLDRLEAAVKERRR